ncbi:MAG: hypothetical protein ACFCUS_01000 [Rubrimonas sp.]|uniref:hypothetical protein n=1 Tax=Rubrimonas sp. TaxID=2036015 RepID=UPI002FDEE47A
MISLLARAACAAAICLCAFAANARATQAEPPRNAVAAFGAWMTDENWEDLFLAPHDIDFEDAGLVGVALSRRIAEPVEGLSFEIEGQIAKHFGSQSHWEVNAPILTARWSRFPWDETVATSAAFGLGLSVASETPELEVANEGDSSQTMAYWMIELALGRPGSDWEVIGRVHHRSNAYGLFGDDGGSNALALGLRRRF